MRINADGLPHWTHNYAQGKRYEITYCALPDVVYITQAKFHTVMHAFRSHGYLMIGVIEGGEHVRLNPPSDLVLGREDQGVFLVHGAVGPDDMAIKLRDMVSILSE